MKLKKLATSMVAMLLLMAVAVTAQELDDPGITPDSPLYPFDKLFDVFQSKESLANERAAEVLAMAHANHEKGLAKAMAGYDKAMANRAKQAEGDAEEAAEVARQSTEHIVALANARSRVPEQAQGAIDAAVGRSAAGRDHAINALGQQNAEAAGIIAQETLQRVMENTPEQAQAGLQKALTAMTRRGAPDGIGMNGGEVPIGMPPQATEHRQVNGGGMQGGPVEGGMPAETGMPDARPEQPAVERGPQTDNPRGRR